MARAGDILVRTMDLLAAKVRPGVTTGISTSRPRSSSARRARHRPSRAIAASRARSARRPTTWSSTASRIASGSRGGDVLSVDIGVIYDGWVADAARTFSVGEVSPVAVEAPARSPRSRSSRPWSSAGRADGWETSGHAVQQHVEAAGFSIVRSLVGHGIGRSMHEEPQIANYGNPGKGDAARGGHGARRRADDHGGAPHGPHGRRRWAIYSQDGSLAAHFEFTIAITPEGPRILTPWHESKSRVVRGLAQRSVQRTPPRAGSPGPARARSCRARARVPSGTAKSRQPRSPASGSMRTTPSKPFEHGALTPITARARRPEP